MSLYRNIVATAAGLTLAFGASAAPEPARAFYACIYKLDQPEKTCEPIQMPGIIKNEDMALAPASLNKMMTAHLTLQYMKANGKSLDDPFTAVTARDVAEGKIGERNGKPVAGGWTLRDSRKSLLSDVPMDHVFTYREVIHAMTVYSANDFATAAARAIAPDHSLETFADMMNAEGARMGMANTVFKTASGMPATGQTTTAEDMTMLAHGIVGIYGINQFGALFGQTSAVIAGVEIPGHLRLLSNSAAGIAGGKTGSDASGTNLSGFAQRGDVGVAFTTLGSPGGDKGRTRDTFTLRMLNRIFAALGVGDATAATEAPAKIAPKSASPPARKQQRVKVKPH